MQIINGVFFQKPVLNFFMHCFIETISTFASYRIATKSSSDYILRPIPVRKS